MTSKKLTAKQKVLRKCGHHACDICGVKTCAGGISLDRFGLLEACSACVRASVQFAYDAACRFGGAVIDPKSKCWRKPND